MENQKETKQQKTRSTFGRAKTHIQTNSQLVLNEKPLEEKETIYLSSQKKNAKLLCNVKEHIIE